MKKLFLFCVLFAACDFPIPDAGCAVVTKNGNVVHVDYCDAGVAGSAGSSAGAGSGGMPHEHDAGVAGTASSGTGGSSGTPAAGAGGGEHMHGGLAVTLPFPAPKFGRTDKYLVSAEGRVPVKDAGGIGAARTRCFVSHENFDDAIVFPGQPGMAHAHQYAGADKVDAFGIDPSSGGTCRGGAANLSAYWWPALLAPDGTVQRPIYTDHYYKQSHYDLTGTPRVSAPPKGLKIVSGDMTARPSTPQNRNRFYWTCGETDGGSKQAGIPTTCADSVIGMHVFFPECNDGRLDSANHKDHMSFPVNGSCPATHPFLIPAVSFHIYFRNVPANSRLSCDAPTGQGGFCLHADWISNWDDAVMQSMVNSCVNTGLSCGSDLVGDGTSLGIFGGN